jgi:hypothetical protein
MDPITIIVFALATGAAAGLRPTAEKVIKDTYEGIKTLIHRKYGRVDVDVLEADPASEARQNVVKEDLQKTEAGKDEELLRQAQVLLDAIQEHEPGAATAVGVNLEDVKVASSLNIEDIMASGTGVDITRTDVGRDMTIRGVRAGETGKNTSNP